LKNLVVSVVVIMNSIGDPERDQALEDYKKSLLESREWEAKLKSLRLGIKDLQKEFSTTEDNIKALQSVGQIIGEVLKQLDDERCQSLPLICVQIRSASTTCSMRYLRRALVD
jgi:ATP-dependent 26S proteasome regulatory subunit